MSTWTRFAFAASLLVGGCAGNPPPQPAPPPTPRARAVLPASFLDRLVDEAAQTIGAELPADPGVANSPTKRVLALPPFTATGPRIREALKSLQGTLLQSQAIRNSFLVMNVSTGDSKRILDELGAARPHQVQDPLGGVQPAVQYNPADLFVLTASGLDLVERNGDEHVYRVHVQVIHPQTRRLVLNKEFQHTVAYNPATNTWDDVPGRR
jgi:hypothetical protein